MRHFHLSDIHEIEVKAKNTAIRSWKRVVAAAHNRAVDVSREYCHIVYFAGVFIEGHGFYTYAAGALLVLSLVGVVIGEGIDEAE